MRRLGLVPDRGSGETIRDYLFTLGTRTELFPEGSQWALWIEDEDRVTDAREHLARYLNQPDDPRFEAARRVADTLREQHLREAIASRKLQMQMADRWRGYQRHAPFTILLVVLSVWVGLLTLFGQKKEGFAPLYFSELTFHIAEGQISYFGMADTLRSWQFYRWWSPILIHYGPAHLLLNMLSLWHLGQAIELRSGSVRYFGMVLVIAFISNLGQYLMSGPTFGGMSGVVFGLFGFLWMKSRFSPEYGVYVARDFVFRFLFFAFLMATGIAGPIANTAHFAGLGAGMLLALIPVAPLLWKQYQRRRNLP